MKILRLDLIAYGIFTQTPIDLSQGNEGLHIIYGPNEAGKSLTLRALVSLLFGIPERTPDGFLHDNRKLRIGACLCHSDKSELAFIRRKARKGSIEDADGNSLDESVLQKYLGGLNRDIFSMMFGIDHQQLVEGGKQIVTSGGSLGESLFAAGTGVRGLREVLESLHTEAGKIFNPRTRGASDIKINRLVNQFNDIKSQEKELMLSTRDWEEHKKALEDEISERERVEEEISSLSSKERWFQRLKESFPKIAARKDLRSRLDDMENVVLLDQGFAGEHQKAAIALENARQALNRANIDLDNIRTKKEGLSIPEKILGQEKVINALHERIGSYQTSREDKSKRESEFKILEGEAKNILADLRPGLDLEHASDIRLNKTQRTRIQKMGFDLQTLMEDKRRASETVYGLKKELEKAKEELTKIRMDSDPKELRSAVRRAQSHDEIEQKLENARTLLNKEKKQAEIELKSLQPRVDDLSLEKLEALIVPFMETVDRFQLGFEETDTKLYRLVESMEQEAHEAEKSEAELKAFQLAGAVPTEQELQDSRARRNHGWELVRKAWLKHEDISESEKAFHSELPLPEAYEKAVEEGDEISDRLRREAERVAKKVAMIARLDQCRFKLEELRKGHEHISSQSSILEQEWIECWSPASIHPLPPKEMASWLKQRGQITARSGTIRNYQDDVEQMEKKINEIRAEINVALAKNHAAICIIN